MCFSEHPVLSCPRLECGQSTACPRFHVRPPDLLNRDVRTWAKDLGLKPNEIHVRPMKRKWASSSSKDRLTFAASLLKKPKSVRSEAIVHELLHLKYPNHGQMFKALFKTYLGKEEAKNG